MASLFSLVLIRWKFFAHVSNTSLFQKNLGCWVFLFFVLSELSFALTVYLNDAARSSSAMHTVDLYPRWKVHTSSSSETQPEARLLWMYIPFLYISIVKGCTMRHVNHVCNEWFGKYVYFSHGKILNGICPLCWLILVGMVATFLACYLDWRNCTS